MIEILLWWSNTVFLAHICLLVATHPLPSSTMRPAVPAAEQFRCTNFSPLLFGFGLFSLIASGFGLAAYHLKDDPATFAFVQGAFHLVLVAILCCFLLREPGSAWRDRLKDFACAFAALLFLCVAYMVMLAADLALAGAALVWFIAVSAGSGVFYIFFSRDSLITSGFGLAAYHLKDDPATFAFVQDAFHLVLVAIFCCLLLREKAAPGSAWRDRLKDFACAFAALLFLCVAYMVMGAAELALAGAALVWFIAVSAGSGVFYIVFSRDRVYDTPDETMLPTV